MKKTRILAAILASVMLLPTFASCADEQEGPETQADVTTAAETEDSSYVKDNLPDDLDFGGTTVVILNDESGLNVPDEIHVDDLNSEPVNDAIYERNKAVEARLNIKIEGMHAKGAVVDQVITSVNGGSADYDIMVERCWRAAPKTIEGYFANLRATEHIDFDQIWWTQGFNEVMNYKSMQFAVTGAMVLSTYRRTHATVFNKRLFTNANQKFLYEYVEDGTWTLDTQASLASLLFRDDGNGVQDENSDVFGFVTNNYTSADPYWSACKLDIIAPNEEEGYLWVFDAGKMHDAMEKVLNLYFNTDNGTLCLFNDDSVQGKTQAIFADGRAAMATLGVGTLETSLLRNMEDSYGVVPMPKFDEAQAEYRSQMHDAFTVVCVPTTVKGERLTQISAVLEAMGSTSYNTIRPVYYETTLRTKIAQDPQSAQMMEILINGIYIDAGIVYSHNLGSFHKGIQEIVTAKNNSSASLFKAKDNAAKKQLIALLRKLDRLESKQ